MNAHVTIPETRCETPSDMYEGNKEARSASVKCDRD